MGDAILCRTVVDEDTGLLQVRRVVETAEALAANHYVACLPCLGHQDESSHDDGVGDDGWYVEDEDLVGYYRSVGVVVVHTVRNGDCAFDAMGLMVGEPRTEARRRELRFEVVDYMLKHAENAALHRALANCFELSIPHDCGDELMADHVPLPFRGSESAESGDEADLPAEPTDSRTFPALVVDAVAWASGLSQCDGETALALCRRLPSWCLDEQVRKFNERRAGPEAEPSSGDKKFAAERGKYRSSLLMARDRAAERFEGFLKKKGYRVEIGEGPALGHVAQISQSQPRLGGAAHNYPGEGRSSPLVRARAALEEPARELARREGEEETHPR